MTEEQLGGVEEASLTALSASGGADRPATLPGTVAGPKPAIDALRDGVIAGLLGYATIALFFAAASVASGRSPFYIAALLGSVLFLQPAGSDIHVGPGPVLAYNGVHLLALIVAGVGLAGLARLAARALQGWYLAVIAVAFALIHILALPIWFGEQVRVALPAWLVMSGTALGTLVMCAYLWVVNPDVRTAMHEPDE
jgi:hypothetical protein